MVNSESDFNDNSYQINQNININQDFSSKDKKDIKSM